MRDLAAGSDIEFEDRGVRQFKGVPGEWQLFAARLSERAEQGGRVRLFNQDTKVQALKRAPLFEGLSRKELVLLARVTEDLEVPAGEVLCREGETGQEFFVIVEGKTDVTSKGKRVATRGDGDFVGEIALLDDTKRTATVTVKAPLRPFVLMRQDFRRLVNENRSVERKVMQALARRVVELTA